jgi:hypothetical protein
MSRAVFGPYSGPGSTRPVCPYGTRTAKSGLQNRNARFDSSVPRSLEARKSGLSSANRRFPSAGQISADPAQTRVGPPQSGGSVPRTVPWEPQGPRLDGSRA